MKYLFALFFALSLPACAVNPVTGNPRGIPSLDNGKPQIPNACVVDAIDCYSRLAKTGADPQILEIQYKTGALYYGHWMTLFSWPPLPSKSSRDYVFDRTNKSTALPPYVDPSKALSVARFAIPSTVSARWVEPKEFSKHNP